MIDLDLSIYHQYLKLSKVDDQQYVYDPVRKQDYQALPEELVRQTWIRLLNKQHNISFASLGVEKKISLLQNYKLYDLVYYKKGIPHVLFEFKSFKQKINENTCAQIASYNLELKVPFIILSNGVSTYAFHVDHKTRIIDELSALPF